MRPKIDIKTLGALFFEWSLSAATIALCLYYSTIGSWIIGIIVLATRQHALLMLYHDAVHGLLARNDKLNDFIINVLVGIPFLLPVEVFRPLHFNHHRQLGTDEDPERTILFAGQQWQYKPLSLFKLSQQLVADLLLVNGFKTLIAWKKETKGIAINNATWLAGALWIAIIAVLFIYSTTTAAQVLLLWFIPVMTLTNLLQKIRSFAEHGGGTDSTDDSHEWTYSWRVGILGRLTIWPYNINRHREHHSTPSIPWHQLPEHAKGAAGDLDSSQLLKMLCLK